MRSSPLVPLLTLLHVLVIEDDPDMRALLCRTLRRQRVGSVIDAASADDALTLLQAPQNEINFVLSDWNLPGMSGLELCRALKFQKPIIPILMITGRDDASSVRQARGAGIDGYIVKPVMPSALVRKIEFIVRQTWERRVGDPHSDEATELKSR